MFTHQPIWNVSVSCCALSCLFVILFLLWVFIHIIMFLQWFCCVIIVVIILILIGDDGFLWLCHSLPSLGPWEKHDWWWSWFKEPP